MNKFTACLVHEEDKAAIVSLRDSIKLNEKDTMSLIVKYAMQHESEIRQIAEEQVKIVQAEREENRKLKYELLKQAMKEVREKAKMKATIDRVKAAETANA